MRHPGLIETQFHIPVELTLVMYSFQPATGLVVARLKLIASIYKKALLSQNVFIRELVFYVIHVTGFQLEAYWNDFDILFL